MRFRSLVQVIWYTFLGGMFLALFSFGRILWNGFYIPLFLPLYGVLALICVVNKECRVYWQTHRRLLSGTGLIILAVLLSLAHSHTLHNIGSAAEMVLYVSMVLIIPPLLKTYRLVRQTWTLLPLYTLGTVILDSLVQADTPWLQLGDIGSRNVGAFLLVVAAMLAILAGRDKKTSIIYRATWFLIGAILGILVFYTWSRGGVIALIFGGIGLMVVQLRAHKWEMVVTLFLIFTIGFIVMPAATRVRLLHTLDFTHRRLGISLPPTPTNSSTPSLASRENTFSPSIRPTPSPVPYPTSSTSTPSRSPTSPISRQSPLSNSNPWRIQALRKGIHWMLTHPVFGIGVGNAPKGALPHNSYILMGAETGVLGMLGLIFLMNMLVTYIVRAWGSPSHPLKEIAYALSLVLLLYTLFADISTWIYFWILLGVCFSLWDAYVYAVGLSGKSQ